MRLLFNNLLLRLAFAGMIFWDAPASEMGVVEVPDEGGAGDGKDRAAGDSHDEDVDDRGDDHEADGERDDADASARRSSARGDQGDDDDDDEDDDDADDEDEKGELTEERFRKVLKAKRRLERQGKKFRPTRERLKELEAAGLSIDDLVHSHRSLASMQRRLEENPKLRALIEGDDEASASRDTRGRSSNGKREPVKYPFKTDNESGQFFQRFHEDYLSHRDEVGTRLEKIEKLLEGEVRERHSERQSASVKEWRTQAETAAKVIPEGFRDLFMHTIGLEMRRALRGEIKATPQQVIDAHLNKLRKKGSITDATKKRASEAAREFIARRNETLPRRPAGSGGPGPVKERRIPRMSDYNRNLKSRFGGS